MYILNVTTNIDESRVVEWLKWMKEKHIPKMLATGCFTGAKLTRVMIQEQMGGKTYSVQYAVKDKETFKGYYVAYANELNANLDQKFKGSYVSFTTELEVIGDFY